MPNTLYAPGSVLIDHHDLTRFGITERQVILELYWLDGGKEGFYLANLRDKRYCYCGLTYKDVQKRLFDLGFGVRDEG